MISIWGPSSRIRWIDVWWTKWIKSCSRWNRTTNRVNFYRKKDRKQKNSNEKQSIIRLFNLYKLTAVIGQELRDQGKAVVADDVERKGQKSYLLHLDRMDLNHFYQFQMDQVLGICCKNGILLLTCNVNQNRTNKIFFFLILTISSV